MEAYLSHLSLVGSAMSMAATLYFWLVRMRQERPCLKPVLVDKELFLGGSRDGVRQIGLKVGIIVANYSILPNAVLGARLWVKLREGWQEVGQLAFDKTTPQPFNIPPMHTVLLRLSGNVSFPYQADMEDGNKTIANYLTGFADLPLEMKLDLRQLNDRIDSHVMHLPTEAERTALAGRPLSIAA